MASVPTRRGPRVASRTRATRRGRLARAGLGAAARLGRDRAVLGLAASLVALLVVFFLALGYLSADRPGRHFTLDELNAALAGRPDHGARAARRGRRRGRQAARRRAAFSVAYPASDAVTGAAGRQGVRRRRPRERRQAVDEAGDPHRHDLPAAADDPGEPVRAAVPGVARGRVGALARRRDVRHAAQGQEGRDAGLDAASPSTTSPAPSEAVEELRRGRRLPARPEPLRGRRRGPAQGRAAVRPAGLRQDAARARRRRRGRRPVLLRRRRRVRRVARRRRRGARARPLRRGCARPRRRSSSSTSSTPPRAGAASGGSRRRRPTSASRRSTSCWSRSTASTSRPASSSSAPRTGPTSSTPRCCVPGRFDRHVTVDQPDHEGRVRDPRAARARQADRRRRRLRGARAAHARLHRRRPRERRQRGRAADRPRARRERSSHDLLDEAVQRVLHGPRRRGRVLSDDERDRAAVHESGHAVVAAALGRGDDVHRVSILARGRGLGLTSRAPRLRRRPAHARTTCSPSSWWRSAGWPPRSSSSARPRPAPSRTSSTRPHLAREMVGRYGMSERLGRVRLLASRRRRVPRRHRRRSPRMSERTHEEFDARGPAPARRRRGAAHARSCRAQPEGPRRAWSTRLLERETLEGEALVGRARPRAGGLMRRAAAGIAALSAVAGLAGSRLPRRSGHRPAPDVRARAARRRSTFKDSWTVIKMPAPLAQIETHAAGGLDGKRLLVSDGRKVDALGRRRLHVGRLVRRGQRARRGQAARGQRAERRAAGLPRRRRPRADAARRRGPRGRVARDGLGRRRRDVEGRRSRPAGARRVPGRWSRLRATGAALPDGQLNDTLAEQDTQGVDRRALRQRRTAARPGRCGRAASRSSGWRWTRRRRATLWAVRSTPRGRALDRRRRVAWRRRARRPPPVRRRGATSRSPGAPGRTAPRSSLGARATRRAADVSAIVGSQDGGRTWIPPAHGRPRPDRRARRSATRPSQILFVVGLGLDRLPRAGHLRVRLRPAALARHRRPAARRAPRAAVDPAATRRRAATRG